MGVYLRTDLWPCGCGSVPEMRCGSDGKILFAFSVNITVPEAVMAFLAARYGTKENLVCGWILGNEVNSAAIWNYGGGKSLDNYMANYAPQMRGIPLRKMF